MGQAELSDGLYIRPLHKIASVSKFSLSIPCPSIKLKWDEGFSCETTP